MGKKGCALLDQELVPASAGFKWQWDKAFLSKEISSCSKGREKAEKRSCKEELKMGKPV